MRLLIYGIGCKVIEINFVSQRTCFLEHETDFVCRHYSPGVRRKDEAIVTRLALLHRSGCSNGSRSCPHAADGEWWNKTIMKGHDLTNHSEDFGTGWPWDPHDLVQLALKDNSTASPVSRLSPDLLEEMPGNKRSAIALLQPTHSRFAGVPSARSIR